MNHALYQQASGSHAQPDLSHAPTPPPSPLWRAIPTFLCALLGALLATTLGAASAHADPLQGTVIDAFSGEPVAGARVIALEAGVDTLSARDGSFTLDLAPDTDHTLMALVDGMDPAQALRRTRQRVGWEAHLRVFAPDTIPYALEEGHAWGAPLSQRPLDPLAPQGPVSLQDFLPTGDIGPLWLTFPGELPEAFRVGRRMASSCRDNPVQRIDTVPVEEYVQGVLIPEIGVFRAVQGGEAAAEAVFQAFAIAARSYALYFYLKDPDATYHLDDTACNQRYEDDRNAWVEAQVALTEGQILVSARDHAELDKFEYAASCGRHGTRPEYQDELVPDLTGQNACVRSWCGHNDCAAHEVNPDFPDSGRCLVRGVCQWGAVERSQAGANYLEILAHYQPNLDVITIGAPDATTQVVGFIREGDRFTGQAVPGVRVQIGAEGPSGISNEDGFYEIDNAPPGLQHLTFSSDNIVPLEQSYTVLEGAVNWLSVAVEYDEEYVPAEPAPEPPPEPVPDAGSDDITELDASAPDAAAHQDTNTPDAPLELDTSASDTFGESDIRPESPPASEIARYSIVRSRVSGCSVPGRASPSRPALAAALLTLSALFACGPGRRRPR